MESQVDYLVGEDESEGEDKEMTNDKAIVIIDNEKPHCGRRITFTEEEKCEAFEMAIEALKAESCEDAVRRETVRDMFCEIHCHNERSKCVFRNICKYMNHVSALPPATPLPDKIDGMLEDAYEHGYQQARYDYEVQLCEDAIDRRALRAQFNHLDEVYEGMSEEEEHEAYIYGQIIRAIDFAPPVAPKQKTGKWIKIDTNMYSCSSCSHCFSIVPEDNNISQFKWCPHCGAKMEGECK